MKNPNFLLGMKHGSTTVQPTNSTLLTHIHVVVDFYTCDELGSVQNFSNLNKFN